MVTLVHIGRGSDFMNKLELRFEMFKKGFTDQIVDPGTIAMSTGVGLWQGLKYTGDFTRGLRSGLVVLGVLGAINGFRVMLTTDYDNIIQLKVKED